jgi:hypothetical protein
LVTKGDVAVVSATGALLPRTANVGLWPDVGDAVFACADDLDWLSTPERFLGGLDQFDLDNFARNHARAEDDPSIEAANS